MSGSLPSEWAWASIGETGQYINGYAFKPTHWGAFGEPIIRIQNLTDESKALNRTEIDAPASVHVAPGEILVSWSATLDVFVWRREPALLNQHIFRVIPNHEVVEPRWLFHGLKVAIGQLADSAHAHGSTMAHINRGPFLAHPLPLPPLGEQRRIADRLDELLSEHDAAVGELQQAQVKLTQYRQSLLKAAIEGALTAEWRAQNPPRPQRHELPATTAAPEWLPSGWAWTSVEFLPSVSMSNGRSVPTSADGAKVLRLTAVRNGRIDLSEYKHGAWSDAEAAPHAVRVGDLLVVRGNGSLSLVGRAGVVPKVVEQIAYPDTLIRVRVSSQVVRPEWLALLWDSSLVRDHLERRARTSAGIYKISQPDIASAPVPLPSLAEQDAALALWDEHLERIAAMEHSMLAARRMATAQRQNILRAAFSGQLVPQDPNDEPASALLERIRTQRSAAPAKQSTRRGRAAKMRA